MTGKKEHTKLGWCGELGVDLEEEGDWDQGTWMECSENCRFHREIKRPWALLFPDCEVSAVPGLRGTKL